MGYILFFQTYGFWYCYLSWKTGVSFNLQQIEELINTKQSSFSILHYTFHSRALVIVREPSVVEKINHMDFHLAVLKVIPKVVLYVFNLVVFKVFSVDFLVPVSLLTDDHYFAPISQTKERKLFLSKGPIATFFFIKFLTIAFTPL